MSTEDWLDIESATGTVDLYTGDACTCFIGPSGADWAYRIEHADTQPGGFARWADTMHDGYRMGHERVSADDSAIGVVCATSARHNGHDPKITTDGHCAATGAARVFLGTPS